MKPNPFERLSISLALSYMDLITLKRILESIIPSNNETTILYLHEQVTRTLQTLEDAK